VISLLLLEKRAGVGVTPFLKSLGLKKKVVLGKFGVCTIAEPKEGRNGNEPKPNDTN
jgi:hypothetical protein